MSKKPGLLRVNLKVNQNLIYNIKDQNQEDTEIEYASVFDFKRSVCFKPKGTEYLKKQFFIYSSWRRLYSWSTQWNKRISRDIDNIDLLPCKTELYWKPVSCQILCGSWWQKLGLNLKTVQSVSYSTSLENMLLSIPMSVI